DERYPAAIPVTLTLTGAGTHEIRGECSYQTVEVDEDLLADLLDDGFEPQALGVAAVEYPYELDELGPLTWDWVDEPLVARGAGGRGCRHGNASGSAGGGGPRLHGLIPTAR